MVEMLNYWLDIALDDVAILQQNHIVEYVGDRIPSFWVFHGMNSLVKRSMGFRPFLFYLWNLMRS
eukprot:8013091-Prorocentrum_lima.AAC.1